MSKLPVVSGREVIVALQRIGYLVVRQRGSHVRMRHPDDLTRRPVGRNRRPKLVQSHTSGDGNC